MSGVLCLHGFTGAPFELQPLADALAADGWQVSQPTLAGHGGGTRELAAATWRDWQQSAEEALISLVAETQRPAAVVGGSMGGLLALRLARLHPSHVSGIVLLAPPLRLRPIEQRGIGALTSLAELIGLGDGATVPRTGGPDLTDEVLARSLAYGKEYPLAALGTLLELQNAVGEDLGFISTPALIVHGGRDRTVPIAVSDEIARRLASLRVERLMLAESGRLLALDVERDRLAHEVQRFLSTLLLSSRSASAGA